MLQPIEREREREKSKKDERDPPPEKQTVVSPTHGRVGGYIKKERLDNVLLTAKSLNILFHQTAVC